MPLRKQPLGTCTASLRIANARRGDGFALVLTITLMAFILLMMLSLATLTTLETRLATDNRLEKAAQQNALFALNLALGELQKYAGPDQRTTARADIDSNLVNTNQANGHWLGVYGNGVPVDYLATPTEIQTALTNGVAPNGSQAVLLNWLVSGNESTAFDPVSDIDVNDGHIVSAPTGYAHLPSDPVNLQTMTLNTDGSSTHALLVSSGSVEDTSDRVAAPLENIINQRGSVEGRYAWWVGDEGIKARIDIPLTTEEAMKPFAFTSAQRTAIELMDGINKSSEMPTKPAPGDLLSAYDPAADSVSNLLKTEFLPLLSSANRETLEDARRLRFHDITSYSETVLADTYAGGLKEDLSAILATGASNPADSDLLFVPSPTVATGLVDGDPEFGIPTWGHLRSYAQTQVASGIALSPRLSTDVQAGISPVITGFELGIELAAINPSNPSETFSPAAEGDELGLALYPRLILWNPYTVPIAGQTYEVTFNTHYGFSEFAIYCRNAADNAWDEKARVYLDYDGGAFGSTAPSNRYLGLRFKVDCPEIPAGQSFVFSLNGSEGEGKRYDADLGEEPQNTLTQGYNPAGYVLLRGKSGNVPVIGPGEATRRFQLVNISAAGNNYSREADVYLTPVGLGQATAHASERNLYQSVAHLDLTIDANIRGNSGVLHDTQTASLTRSQTIARAVYWIRSRFTDEALIRWIASANPRAKYQQRLLSKSSQAGQNVKLTPYVGEFEPYDSVIMTNLEPGLQRASSAMSISSGSSIVDSTLFEFRPSAQPLLSLGQLQHANLSLLDVYPAYPFGNSAVSYRFKSSDGSLRSQLALTMLPDSLVAYPASYMSSFYDVSFLLNRALWDRYFLSTIPHPGTGVANVNALTPIPAELPNSRLQRLSGLSDAEMKVSSKAAAGLTLKGGFNINSTSEQAWRAVLGGVNKLAFDPENPNATSASELMSALSRFAKPVNPDDYSAESVAWLGYRELNERQIALLAKAIVAEIRLRGPFVSLGDFVNRRLYDENATDVYDLRLKGALQAAIDSLYNDSDGINLASPPGMAGNPFNTGAVNAGNSYSQVLPAERANRLPMVQGGATLKPTATAAAGAPQYLTQADILSAIGAGLSARSDTFVIRAYGETLHPVTGDVTGRAWCEAVVQRRIEPLQRLSSDPNSSDFYEPAQGSPGNPSFGRRFEVVSFHWLSKDEV